LTTTESSKREKSMKEIAECNLLKEEARNAKDKPASS
jgi:hypothetical protein